MVGVEDEEDVEGAGEDGVGLEPGLGHLPEHGEEVGDEVERVVRVDERHAHAEPVGGRGQGRHFGDEADDLLVAGLGIEDVLGVEVEGGEGGHGGDEHPHRMGVVVEALQEPLSYVLVDERVVRHVVAPLVELRLVRQLALQQEIGHLQIGGVLGQLLNGIAPVAQDAGVPVEERDGTLAGRRRHEAGVVEPHPRQELGPLRRRDTAVDERNLNGLAIAIVRDGDALGHVKALQFQISVRLDPRTPDRCGRHGGARPVPGPAGQVPAATCNVCWRTVSAVSVWPAGRTTWTVST